MKLASGHHLTYCTNIHPGESWHEIFGNLKQHLPTLKAKLSPEQSFGIGLRLSNQASLELLRGNNLEQLQAWLNEVDCYVFTLNGFPYGGFHDQVVKDQVYAPDWSTPARCDYTLRLIEILSCLLPTGVEGSISTLPLSYKPWFQGQRFSGPALAGAAQTKLDCYRRSVEHLMQVVTSLVQLQQRTGQLIHLGLEPEPDGLVENSLELIDFVQTQLIPQGAPMLMKHLSIEQATAEKAILEHIRLCYDTCHFALQYEDPALALAQLQNCGIKLSKIQLSSALKVSLSEPSERQQLQQHLVPFAESTYLHQVVEQRSGHQLIRYRDLDAALQHLDRSAGKEWRIHFHVPIFQETYQQLASTQDHLRSLLSQLDAMPDAPHLEIETYTWDVLPEDMKLDVQASISREFEWVLDVMEEASTAEVLG